jgi:CoA:oxalate CoA-transferase
VRFSDWHPQADVKADMLGEHNEAILAEISLTPAEIETLYREKVLVRDSLLDRLEPREPAEAKS